MAAGERKRTEVTTGKGDTERSPLDGLWVDRQQTLGGLPSIILTILALKGFRSSGS